MLTNELAIESNLNGLEFSSPGEEPTRFEQMLYRDVVVQGYRVTEVNSMYGVPREKIAECRQRVGEWLVRTIPRSQLSCDEQRCAVEKLAIDRLEHLYCEVMEAWRDSRAEQATTRSPLAAPSQAVTSTRMGTGRPALVVCAAKIGIQAQLQMWCIDAREGRADQAERAWAKEQSASARAQGMYHEGRGAEVAAAPGERKALPQDTTPSIGECSQNRLSATNGETKKSRLTGATPVLEMIYKTPKADARQVQRGSQPPVHGDEPGVAGGCRTGHPPSPDEAQTTRRGRGCMSREQRLVLST